MLTVPRYDLTSTGNTMRQRRHPIVATLSRDMQAAYRRLHRNADTLGYVLVYDASGVYQEMQLVYPAEADDPVLLHGRIVLYDPRLSQQKSLFSG